MFSLFPLFSLAYALKCPVSVQTPSTSVPTTSSTTSFQISSQSGKTISAGCKSALDALGMGQNGCPINNIGSFVDSNSSSANFPIQILCGKNFFRQEN